MFAGTISGAYAAKDKGGEGYGAYQNDDRIRIQGIQLNSDETALVIKANRAFNGSDAGNVSTLKLPSPDRLLIEIPNAELGTRQTTITLNKGGISHIELSENKSRFYSSVRAVVHVANLQTLSRLSTSFENNTLRVEGLIPGAPVAATQPAVMATPKAAAPTPHQKDDGLLPVALQKNVGAPPVPGNIFGDTDLQYLGSNVIDDIYVRDDQLVVQAAPGSQALRIKNRFTLDAPSRLVLDLDNTVLASRDLLNPVTGKAEDFRQVRVGQFDEKTVRIVIETGRPDEFEVVYNGSDKRQIAISPNMGTSITKLSAHTALGHVQDFNLEKDRGQTILRLSSDVPMVHRFTRKDNKILLELLNVAAKPGYLPFDKATFPEVEDVHLEPLTSGQPNSKLVLNLANANLNVSPRLYDDGKTLELAIAEAAMPVLITGNGGSKAPYPARIVIDAGHGGKDIGANRQGVREKDLNLSLALMLRDALEAKGFKVYMTRSTDVFLPLPEITRITNSIKPDLFVSIHHNASVNAAVHGIETYYYTAQSRPLADRVHNRMINMVSAKDNGVKKAMFYVIHHTPVPAILCEIGYVSNPSELSDLQTYERKQKSVRAISEGVVDYLKTRMSAKAK